MLRTAPLKQLNFRCDSLMSAVDRLLIAGSNGVSNGHT